MEPIVKLKNESLEVNLMLSGIYWIDFSPTDGNLVAAAGTSRSVRIYDRRQKAIAKDITLDGEFGKLASYLTLEFSLDFIECVRWNKAATLLAIAREDRTNSLIDFASEKIFHNFVTGDQGTQNFLTKFLTIVY